jgi:hypothetical protein
MLSPEELERRREEDVEFKQELERRRSKIAGRAAKWQARSFFFVWLLAALAMMRSPYGHGVIGWIFAALWVAAIIVFAGAGSAAEWHVGHEIERELSQRKHGDDNICDR